MGAGDQDLLNELAIAHNCLRGGQPNVTELNRRIARNEIPLGETLSPEVQGALMLCLQESQDMQRTHILANYLKSRGDLQPQYQEQIESWIAPARVPWVPTVAQYIERQQPFELFYTDASGKSWVFRCRWACFQQKEKRTYLECWCDETEGNQDLPGLQHNWSFRPDRIGSAGAVAIDAEWRTEGLDAIAASFHLLGGLAHAYEPREEDIHQEWIKTDSSHILVVQRQITSSFWFKREVLPYGKDCIVQSPAELKDLIAHEIREMMAGYS